MFVKPWLHTPISSSRPVVRGEDGEVFPKPAMFGGPTITQKYKSHQNAPF